MVGKRKNEIRTLLIMLFLELLYCNTCAKAMPKNNYLFTNPGRLIEPELVYMYTGKIDKIKPDLYGYF